MMKQLLRTLPGLAVAATLAAGVLVAGGTADAQSPPSPPHTYFGSNPMLDGTPVADGAVVVAIGESGDVVASGSVDGGNWVLMVDSADASTVTITIGDAAGVGPLDVEAGSLSEVTLDLTSGAAPDPDPDPGTGDPASPPATLPSSGTGGLADGDGPTSSALPIAIAVVIALVAIGGVRVLRTSR